MFRKARDWFSNLSRAGKIGVISAAIIGTSVAAAPFSSSKPQQPTPAPVTTQPETQGDKIERKTVTETGSIAFEKTYVNDSSIDKGTSRVQTRGVNGVKILTYEVTLTNGLQTGKKLVKTETTTKPINEVILMGTKVALDCPNGSYINSYGSEVCSPYSSNTTPSGATARCVDGTYSFSQHRSGTCSHHGGVAEWL